MTMKWVGRYDRDNHVLRLTRWTWTRGEVGNGGYSAKLTIGLRRTAFMWQREFGGWLLTILGVRLHYCRSFGGLFA